jgi:hypothetical protein
MKRLEGLTAYCGAAPEIARDAEKAEAVKKSGGCCPDSPSCGS